MKQHLDVLGQPFARDTNYIRILIFSAAFQGIILGFVSYAFTLSVQKLAEATWFSGEYLQAIEFVSRELFFVLLVHLNDINFTHRFPYRVKVLVLLFGLWKMKSTTIAMALVFWMHFYFVYRIPLILKKMMY